MTEPRPYIDLCFENAVAAERRHQDEKWGPLNDRNHTWAEWALILNREVGEANDAIGKLHWWRDGYGTVFDARSELVQVAAVCAAIIELLDDIIHEDPK